MHIGVKKAVAKYLGKEQRHAVARQLGYVDTGRAQSSDLAHRYATHALHHDHIGGAIVPVHLRYQHQIEPLHIAPQLRGTGGLADQIEFIVQVLVEFGHHLARLQALAIGRHPLNPARHHSHQPQIFFYRRQHARAQHLHRHVALPAAAVPENGEVHLRDRRAGYRLAFEG